MSLTADGEFFKCDMCGIYFHMNIFCSHRRQCKGLDSQEMKKELIAEVWESMDKDQREKLKKLNQLNPDYNGEVGAAGREGLTTAEREAKRAPLHKQQTILTTKKNSAWQRRMWDEEDDALTKRAENISDSILDGFDD